MFWRAVLLSVTCAALPASALGDAKEGAAALQRHDCKSAFREFSKAAQQGDAEAQLQLGLMYQAANELRYKVCKDKLPIKPDAKAAAEWFRKAAEQGQAEAQYQAAALLKKDRTKQDERLKWLQRAAENGHPKAQEELGRLYHARSDDSSKNEQTAAEAIKWLTRAAENGSEQAPHRLGLIYYEGELAPRDYIEAVKWFHIGAERNNFASQRYLAKMYEEGQGVPRNLLMAYYWYASIECSAQGGFGLDHYLDRILVRLTPDEREQAKHMKEQWCQDYNKRYKRDKPKAVKQTRKSAQKSPKQKKAAPTSRTEPRE